MVRLWPWFAATSLLQMRALLVSLVLAAPAAHADEGVHVAFVGGAGLAQGQLGGHVEIRKSNLAVFVGTGLIFSTTLEPYVTTLGDSYGGSGYGGVAGARWYFGDRGDRFFLSSQFAFSVQQYPGDPTEGMPGGWHHSNATSLVAGWRFKWGSGFLVDAGAGPGVLFEEDPVGHGYKAHLVPDFTLAVGFEL
jgi:hypothetical protein